MSSRYNLQGRCDLVKSRSQKYLLISPRLRALSVLSGLPSEGKHLVRKSDHIVALDLWIEPVVRVVGGLI